MVGPTSQADDLVLETARQLFLEQGFAATTLLQVARGAGLAESEVRRKYGSKKEFLFAAVRQVILDMLAELKRGIDEVTDDEVIDVVAAHLSTNPYLQVARLLHRDAEGRLRRG